MGSAYGICEALLQIKVLNTDRRWREGTNFFKFTNLHYFPTEKYFSNYISMHGISHGRQYRLSNPCIKNSRYTHETAC